MFAFYLCDPYTDCKITKFPLYLLCIVVHLKYGVHYALHNFCLTLEHDSAVTSYDLVSLECMNTQAVTDNRTLLPTTNIIPRPTTNGTFWCEGFHFLHVTLNFTQPVHLLYFTANRVERDYSDNETLTISYVNITGGSNSNIIPYLNLDGEQVSMLCNLIYQYKLPEPHLELHTA